MLKKSSLLLLAAVMLGGCYNKRTNPYESADKITFWESVEHYVLFAHDCRRSPKECTPVCREDVEKYSRNVEEGKAQWEAFKNMRPFHPVPMGIPLIDKTNRILARLSLQIRKEVVVPLIELDSQGHLEAYRTFQADVDHTMDAFKIDRKSAVQKVYSYWEKRYGAEQCRKLFEAIPLIEKMRADRQLYAAWERNKITLERLLLHFDRDLKQLIDTMRRAKHDPKEIIRLSAAGGQTLLIGAQLTETLTYLVIFEHQNFQKVKDIEAALKDIQRFNKN